ncbi:MAG: hypothetical protein UW86_C0024G0001 [Microgenomates group bacterium GW2011_GWA1_Microgenomates_45_10]|nr:MAG: hypothetical protein UW86_C0024G0001 [Microgenomates group bacterium GW2011_GWA1_Microgenomates_45_10]
MKFMRYEDPRFPNKLVEPRPILEQPTETISAEKRAKILHFLAENLPQTEERIKEPMNPNCEVCVVLPAYSERKYILRPIASLAKQRGVNFDQFELIFVVNNPPSVPERDPLGMEYDYTRRVELYNEGIGDNQETLKLIRYIRGENVDVALTEEEKEIIAEVKKSGLRIFAIDKASEGKALPPEDANVGGARNRGVAEAVARFYEYVHRNGIIAQSDAEIKFPESYVKDLITIFRGKPDLIGVTGYVGAEDSPEDSALFRKLFVIGEVRNRYIDLTGRLVVDEETKEIVPMEPVSFDGSNMASRAFEAAMVGGVPKIPGGEDPAFGSRLAEIGKTEMVSAPETLTIKRFSARTTTGRGQHHIEVAEAIREGNEVLVTDPEEIIVLEKIRKDFLEAVETGNATPEYLRNILQIHGQQLFKDEQLLLLSRRIENLKGMGIKDISAAIGKDKDLVELLKDFRIRVNEIIPQLPLGKGITKLIGVFSTNALLKRKYESIREQIIEEESSLAYRKREILESLLEAIFKKKQTGLDNSVIMDVVRSLKENLVISDEEIKSLEKRGDILSAILEAVMKSEEPRDAIEVLIPTLDFISTPMENPLQLQMIELDAMQDAIQEVEFESNLERRSLENVIKNDFGIEITKPEKVSKGYSSLVYRAHLGDKVIFIRINKDPRVFGVELLGYKAFKEQGIPVPEVISCLENPPSIGRSTMIMSSAEGIEMREADISPEQSASIYQNLGELLRKIHNIKLKGFGTPRVNNEELEGEFASWKDYWGSKEAHNQIGINFLLRRKLITPDEAKKIEKVYNEIASLDFGQASLLHRDMQYAHLFIKEGKISDIIDLGSLIAGDPRYDIAMSLLFQNSEEQESFKKGYGELANDPVVIKYLLIIIVEKILFRSTTHKKDDQLFLDKLGDTLTNKIHDVLAVIR